MILIDSQLPPTVLRLLKDQASALEVFWEYPGYFSLTDPQWPDYRWNFGCANDDCWGADVVREDGEPIWAMTSQLPSSSTSPADIAATILHLHDVSVRALKGVQ